jgi:hypothetical protein
MAEARTERSILPEITRSARSSLPPVAVQRCVLAPPHSRGEVLLFLHADSTLQSGALDRIGEVLSADARIIDGNFRLVFDGGTRFSRWLTRFCAVIRMLGHYYGDSGIFVRRSVYDNLGGFRPMPVMEDWEFVRRLERFGLTTCIKDPPLITSSRRFEGRRAVKIIYGWVRLHVLFWLGVSPDRLAEIYNTGFR